MKRLSDERGAALVMALILSVIVLAAVSAMLYLVTQGTAISGFQKRYQTAMEAAKGGMALDTREVIARSIASAYLDEIAGTNDNLTVMKSTIATDYSGISLTFPGATSTACLHSKLLLSAVTGTTKSWTGCNDDNYSLDLKKSDGTNISDVTFTLSGAAGSADFKVYAKIVDTVAGNTDTSGLDLIADGGTTGSPSPAPPTNPYLYRVELLGERTSNPDEHSRLSVLYAY